MASARPPATPTEEETQAEKTLREAQANEDRLQQLRLQAAAGQDTANPRYARAAAEGAAMVERALACNANGLAEEQQLSLSLATERLYLGRSSCPTCDGARTGALFHISGLGVLVLVGRKANTLLVVADGHRNDEAAYEAVVNAAFQICRGVAASGGAISFVHQVKEAEEAEAGRVEHACAWIGVGAPANGWAALNAQVLAACSGAEPAACEATTGFAQVLDRMWANAPPQWARLTPVAPSADGENFRSLAVTGTQLNSATRFGEPDGRSELFLQHPSESKQEGDIDAMVKRDDEARAAGQPPRDGWYAQASTSQLVTAFHEAKMLAMKKRMRPNKADRSRFSHDNPAHAVRLWLMGDGRAFVRMTAAGWTASKGL